VSDEFESQRLISRHRAVNGVLAEELANGVHALSINAYTQEEWKALDTVPKTPNCKG
jgi:BolA protein